ncbi:TonB-dependent receptor [Paludibacter sp.]
MKKILIIPFLILFCLFSVNGQNKEFTVSGVVIDQTGESLPGVSIYLKDKPGMGTTTDFNGKFTIKVMARDIIVFTYVGFDNFEHYVSKAESNLKITMKTGSIQMDEVVVTGLGSVQRKVNVVGAISTVSVKELQTPATSINNMLGGRVAGIISTQASGEPGQDVSEFWVRGIGTFGANDQALVLIDGLEGSLREIDPADIESFSVLKDASATAVYGVRGANGVVLVTTKRGEEGKIKITGRFNSTFSYLTRLPNYVGSYEYAKMANEAREVRGNPAQFSEMEMTLIKKNLDPDLYPNVDWQSEILKKASFKQSGYTSIRGGGKVARYFVSLGASNEPAAYRMADNSRYKAEVGYNKFTFRSNVDIDLTKTTKIYFGTEGFYSKNKRSGLASNDYLWQAQALLTPITIPTMYSTGEIPAYGPENSFSPYVMLNHTGLSTNEETNMKVTISIDQDLSKLLKGLRFYAQGAFTNTSFANEQRVTLPDMYYAANRLVNGNLQMVKRVNAQQTSYGWSQDAFRRFHFESRLNYDRVFADMHRFSALIFYYATDQKRQSEVSKYGAYIPLTLAALPIRYQGVSSRLSYTYDDTYIVDVNFGYTGSENFQPGRQYGFFPSVAVGWIPTQYKFVKENFVWLNFLKFRYSYGSVGNDRLTGDRRFPYLTTFGYVNPAWGGTRAITEDNVGADNLVWEKALKSNFGIETHLLKQRVNLVLDFFKDRRNGIFQQREQVPDYIGATSMPYGNVGKMVSYGSDGNISFTQKINNDMSFVVRANYTYSKNIVENWEQAAQRYDYQNYSGWPNAVQRGFISLGLFRDEDDILASPEQFGKLMPGDIKYKDVNGDGKINSDDKVPLSLRNNYPTLMYGFGGEFTYKKFSTAFLFKGRGKTPFYHVGLGNGLGYVPLYGGAIGNVLEQAADPANRWIPRDYAISHGIDPSLAENPNAIYPRLDYGANVNNSQLSDFWRRDGSYIKLQEVSLSYNLDSKAIKNIGVNSIELQLVGTNLYTWDSVKIFHPEQADKNGVVYPLPLQVAFQVYVNL